MEATPVLSRRIADRSWGMLFEQYPFNQGTITSGSVTYDENPLIGKRDPIPEWIHFVQPQEYEPVLIISSTGGLSAFSALTVIPTSTTDRDYEMEQLREAVKRGDEKAFTAIANGIDWSLRSPEELRLGIRYALRVGAHLKARQLAEDGGEWYPDHPDLQRAAHILAPPKPISSAPAGPAGQSAQANIRWLKQHGDQYRGQWVALRNGTLLATGASSKELLSKLENPKDETILITMVY